jgi:hypothetical protein
MWKPYQEIDFNDENIKQYHIDTRDFHCLAKEEVSDMVLDLHKTRKKPEQYFHTGEEIKALLDRYFNESGGPVEWRMFSLSGEASFRAGNWQLKYIRIFRLPEGLVVASKRNEHEAAFVFGKHMLACPVELRYLNAH